MPLLDIIWSIFMFFLLVAWIWVIIGVIGDVFRSKDLNGLAKGIWVLLIIAIPWLGVLAYLIIRGQGMEAPLQGHKAGFQARCNGTTACRR